MAQLPEPTETQCSQARTPHDIFVINLIGNHMLLFAGIATLGQSYMKYLLVVPVLSALSLLVIFYKSSTIRREDNEFAYVHWQIARRWSKILSVMLVLMVAGFAFGWVGHTYLGMMREAVYAIVGGVSILPTLVTVFVLIVIESDALHHARVGTLPSWAKDKYFGVQD